jgi:hypothetical protein
MRKQIDRRHERNEHSTDANQQTRHHEKPTRPMSKDWLVRRK